MVTVRFYGSLRQYGDRFRLDVENAAEAVRALTVQIEGLRKTLEGGMYRVRWGKRDLKQESLDTGLYEQATEGAVLHIVPVAAGAARNPVVNIIIGVVLIVASWYAGGAAGWGYLGTQGFAGATMLFQLGAAMIVMGAASLLTKTPETKLAEEDRNTSSSFSSLLNSYAVGKPVPVAYGEVMAGTRIVSQGLETLRSGSVPEAPRPGGLAGYMLRRRKITPQKVGAEYNTAVTSPSVIDRNYTNTVEKVSSDRD